MSDTKVNIIILNWNGWADTINCLHSIQDTASIACFKIIIIDNGSTDDSITRIKEAYPDVELIQNDKNLGFGGGCNVGLLRSINDNVDFVWLLNNDTTVNSESLQELVNIADTDLQIGIVGSVIYCMENVKAIQTWGGGYINFWTGSVKHIHNKKIASKLQYITGASMLIRTSALREVGMFDDFSYFMYWEDADLCFRFVKNGWRLAVAEKSRILHKESASFINNHHLLVRYFNRSAVIFFCKFYRFCFIPVLTGLSGRLMKRLIYKDSDGFNEIVKILRTQLTRTFIRIFK
jgi:GT2 family glycosyltransferase